MALSDPYIGQRRAYGGSLCTVRYFGTLPDVDGYWLGVEWDNPDRGKHNGTHQGCRLFRCLSSSPTAASFVRPSRRPDAERTLLEAIKFKYGSGARPPGPAEPAADATKAVEISGKLVEAVGFDRIQAQFSRLADLKIVLVDDLVLSGAARRGASRPELARAQDELARTCPKITELDLGWNVIETWQDVCDMCRPFGNLKILKASGLRFRDLALAGQPGEDDSLPTVEELQLNSTLIGADQVINILGSPPRMPSLKTLTLSLNELGSFDPVDSHPSRTFPSVTSLVLDNNKLSDLSFLPTLLSLFPCLKTLSMQGNAISTLNLSPSKPTTAQCDTIETLNLADNRISEYSVVDELGSVISNLTSLRISRNPLHDETTLESSPTTPHQNAALGPVSQSASYYLTLARIPTLKMLNYTTITPRDRENGELYYLSEAEKDLRSRLADAADSPTTVAEKASDARRRYPVYSMLCSKYERPNVIEEILSATSQVIPPDHAKGMSNVNAYPEGSLGSRVVDVQFYLPGPPGAPPESYSRSLTTTLPVYRLKSLVARYYGLPALQFKLIHESTEWDPVDPPSLPQVDGKTREVSDYAWGDWDVDELPTAEAADSNVATASTQPEGDDGHVDHVPANDLDLGQSPGYRKRETEIVDGVREWGEYITLPAKGMSEGRVVKVRVEPNQRDI